MKRTHITHTRDNRRPFYFKQVDHRDARPVIAWQRHGAGQQVLEIDGVSVAEVFPVGDPVTNYTTWETSQRHDARIIGGSHAGTRRAFDDCDAVRLFCESLFAEPAARAA